MIIDGLRVASGSTMKVSVVDPSRRGTQFPASPSAEDVFELTAEYNGNAPGVYVYLDQWEEYMPDANAAPYDMACNVMGKPGAGDTVFNFTLPRAVTIKEGFKGCKGVALAASAGTATFAINKVLRDGSSVALGQMLFSTAKAATFIQSGSGNMEFLPGETLTVTAPDPQDATLSNISMVFVGALAF